MKLLHTPERLRPIDKDLLPVLEEIQSELSKHEVLTPLLCYSDLNFGFYRMVAMYNYLTDFKDLKPLTELRTIRSGFGGYGGQMLPYKWEDNKHQIRRGFCSGGYSEEWEVVDIEFMSGSVGTVEQWLLICIFDRGN